MYGMIPKPRGLFGHRPPWATPGIGDGPRGVEEPWEAPVSASVPQMAPEPRKGGFMAPGGAGRAIAGTIGDVLLQHNDMAPIYAPTMQLKERMEAEEQRRQRERAEGYQDWQRKQEWERANPKPVNNDTVADYEFILRTLGPEKAQEYLENKANPPVWRQGPDGAFYRVDAQQNRPAVGAVVPDPRKQGGPTPQASGGFRP